MRPRAGILAPLLGLALVGAPTPMAAEPPTSGTTGAAPAAVGPRAPTGRAGASSLPDLPQAVGSVHRRPASPRARWAWPLTPRPAVVRPFVPPATPYGAGHRGVDLRGDTGAPVTAVEAGTVTHVGVIAGRGTVTVLHASGVRSTYEPVVASVAVGTSVARGERLGRLAGSGSHCGVEPCLHLGAVRGREYLDPMVFLEVRRVRLLPVG